MEKQMDKKYFIRLLITRCLVAIMLVSGVLAAYWGTDYAVKHMSENYQKYYGYLQNNSEAEEVMLEAAEIILKAVVDNVAGENMEGVHSRVVIDEGCYYKKDGTMYFEKNSDGLRRMTYKEFLADKQIGFLYDTELDMAYIKYANGDVWEYIDEARLVQIKTAIARFVGTEVRVLVWMDDEYYHDMNPGLRHVNSLNDYDLDMILLAMGIAGCTWVLAAVSSVRTKSELRREKCVPIEVPLIGGAGVFWGTVMVFDYFDTTSVIRHYDVGIQILMMLAVGVLLLVGYWCLREAVLQLKEKTIFKNAIIKKAVRWCEKKGKHTVRFIVTKSNYENFSLTKKLWVRRLAFMVVNLIGAVIILPSILPQGVNYLYVTGCVCFLILFMIYNFYEMHFLKSLNGVYNHVEEISKGEYVVHNVEENDLTYDITRKLNELSNSMEDAIEKRISSEKMKVELITNVSHDLKTPLTSIVSYVNLLKEEEMSEVAASYVKILEDKSYQLKNLVSDVFDLAKANSGQEVEIENIDGIMLVHQVLADMEDVIARSGRIIKTDIQPVSFMVKGDGKKLYRALQNLIDNALKYSMEGTRVYVQSEVHQEHLKLTIKNIAAYEMNFTGEEIVERFVRGDESRTTEGSGLGLAIAKSFVEVCKGTMKVEVDGDVFKVEVEFTGAQNN